VYCGGQVHPDAELSAVISLDWMDLDGMGESVGEAVVALGATGGNVTMGAVTVINTLNASSAPAVLAPITDQLGTLNWDHGTLGTQHTRSAPPYGADDGVLDVTMTPFRADNTGITDATAALQAAIDFSRHNYLAL